MEYEQHTPFIKSPQQLIVVILASFLAPVIAIMLLVQLVLGHMSADPGAMTPEATAARIQPVGRVEFGSVMAGAPAAAQKSAAKAGPADGKAIYDKVCTACHLVSVAGSPKLGDKAAWAPRLQAGMGAMLQSVVKGKGAMPPRAGNAALTDAEIRAAIEFMVSQSK